MLDHALDRKRPRGARLRGVEYRVSRRRSRRRRIARDIPGRRRRSGEASRGRAALSPEGGPGRRDRSLGWRASCALARGATQPAASEPSCKRGPAANPQSRGDGCTAGSRRRIDDTRGCMQHDRSAAARRRAVRCATRRVLGHVRGVATSDPCRRDARIRRARRHRAAVGGARVHRQGGGTGARRCGTWKCRARRTSS